jgi:hypothetical protein
MRALAALLSIALIQTQPAHVREGQRVELQFHGYRDRLTQFFEELRTTIQRDTSPEDAATLLRQLEKAPPAVGIYGYQMLPRIVDIPQPPTPIRSFSYSWPITESYKKNFV